MNQFSSIFTAIALAATTISSVAMAQDAPAAAQDTTATLTLTFTGIQTQQGSVLGAVYDSQAAYDGGGAPVRQIMIGANAPEIATQLDGFKPGQYAIRVFHDIDGDMKMGANPFGMPTEPFAFSNNAIGNMGPAKWDAAAFEVTAGANAHSITIQ
jgi:uncharacterized protein (DUF2141 family)